ncbi:glycosyltransferase family 4 protein [Deinococcus aquiradiocola]|uniref:Glycosyl transferase n=1 Tax=Deinococcus aquiradiocola TaxID=393059 RepID=A0A917PSC5_9DEIO|nr:glycosyltransferase family 4 protein [Deinococcus aquiradiocola]GGJ89650.1 glycosyl transferase [Deinococcus aquiradiocola]
MSGPPLKVLFVTDAPAVGGSEVYMRELIPPLRERGVHAEVALPDLEGNRGLREQLKALGVVVHVYGSVSELPPGFDLYLLSSWNPGGYRKYYRALPGPFVALVHDQLMLYVPGLPRGVYRALYEALQARDIRRAGDVVTVSRWGAEYLRSQHGMRAVHAVQNGVNTDKFRPPVGAEREEARAALGFSRFTVLVPARLSAEKNHVALLPVARRLPELEFVLVGSGYMEWPVRRLGSANLRFLGGRNDMPLLYRAADVVLQPTIAENQSLATLEAMASGAAVVCNDIPAQRELIEDRVSGWLVGNGTAGYVEALRALSRDPGLVAAFGRAARARVLERHTLTRNADAFAGTLREIVAGLGYPLRRP